MWECQDALLLLLRHSVSNNGNTAGEQHTSATQEHLQQLIRDVLENLCAAVPDHQKTESVIHLVQKLPDSTTEPNFPDILIKCLVATSQSCRKIARYSDKCS